MKISQDQEVRVLSPSVFTGYYNDYEATEKTFENGWLLTGDAGYFDDDGHLVIIGRKQDIIRDNGRQRLLAGLHRDKAQVLPLHKGSRHLREGRPFITALINIDQGNAGNWAEDRMIPYTTYTDLSQRPEVEQLIVEEVNRSMYPASQPMKIKRFILLYKLLDADDEELTRTGKVRRRFVYGLYLPMIEAMYQGLDDIRSRARARYRDGQVVRSRPRPGSSRCSEAPGIQEKRHGFLFTAAHQRPEHRAALRAFRTGLRQDLQGIVGSRTSHTASCWP